VEAEIQTQFITAGSLLYSVDHRPWMPPDSPWLLSQNWNDLLFAHFAVDAPTLRQMVPDALTLDLYDRVGWVTIAAFCTSHLRPSGIPPLPGLSFFPQLTLRTYVTLQGKPGLLYLSVDAANLSAVWLARVFFRMQYWHASMQVSGATIQARKAEEKAIHLRSSRLHGPRGENGPAKLDVQYCPEGEARLAGRGSLEEFLTERYCVYSWNRRKIYRTEVHHQPWSLQGATVEIRDNTIGAPLGLTFPARPEFCHFSRSLKALIWAPESIRL